MGFYTSLGDNVHHREQCYKESIVVDNVHQHNYKDDEMCINIIMRMTRYASMKIGEKCSIDDCL